jgi:hypothetical protein
MYTTVYADGKWIVRLTRDVQVRMFPSFEKLEDAQEQADRWNSTKRFLVYDQDVCLGDVTARDEATAWEMAKAQFGFTTDKCPIHLVPAN